MNLWTHTTIFHNSINHADKNAHREARYRNKRNKLLSNLSAWVTLISDEYVIGLPPAVKTETTELVMVSWTYNLVSYPSSTISLHADVMDSIQQIKKLWKTNTWKKNIKTTQKHIKYWHTIEKAYKNHRNRAWHLELCLIHTETKVFLWAHRLDTFFHFMDMGAPPQCPLLYIQVH